MNLKFISKVVGVAMVFSFVVAGAAAPAQAVTVEELQAQIDALLAQLAALSGGSNTPSGSGAACYAYARDLTVGAQGADVIQLQTFLEDMNFLTIPAGVAKGYFGPLTRGALASYQAANGVAPAVGYFGPITRGSVAAKCSAGSGDDSSDDDSSTSSDLEGGAGSLEDVDFVSGLNNEEVGEDEEDVEIAGLDIEADGSDIEITAVTLDFDKVTATDDFDSYADNVSVWLDGEKLAEVDADEFEDDDNYSKTISLSSGGIIREGDEGRLVVAVSGISNLDSADAGDKWNVQFTSVRFRDAQDAVITDTTTGDIDATSNNDTTTDSYEKEFSFETFATAADSELKAKLASDNPESTIINVDTSSDTDNVELLRFTLEAEGDSDLRVRDLPITFTATGVADVDLIINTAYVTIDGEEFSETLSTSAAAASTTFEDFDHTIDAGDTVEVVVTVDINDLEGTFGEGDTIKAEFTASNIQVADVEDESGEDLVASDRSGTGLGEVMGLYDVAPNITLVDIDTSVSAGGSNSYDDTGSWEFTYTVEAVDGDIYVSDTASATTTAITTGDTSSSNKVVYLVDKSGTATTGDISAAVTFTESGNNVTDSGVTNGVKITEGSTGTFTLTVERTNNNTGDNGLFRAAITGISWATTDTATQNIYTFNLEEFESNYISIN